MLTLQQYKELNTDAIDNVFYKMIHVVSVVFNLDPTTVEDWSIEELVKKYDKCKHATRITNNYSKTIRISDVDLHLIEFSSMTLGQFIDVETYIAQGYIDNIDKIAAVIYLQRSKGGIYEDSKENYAKVNIDNRAILIGELPAKQTLGAVNQYLKFREKFFDSYDIFYNPLEGVEVEEMDEEELKIYNQEKQKVEKDKSNQYMRVVNDLAQNDITKFEKVLEQNLFLAFNQLTYIISQKSNR